MYTSLPLQQTFGSGLGVVVCGDKESINAKAKPLLYLTASFYEMTMIIVARQIIVGTLGCVFIDNETHESGVTKCTTGEAWSAFS